MSIERNTSTGSVFDGGETTQGLVGPATTCSSTRCFSGTLLAAWLARMKEANAAACVRTRRTDFAPNLETAVSFQQWKRVLLGREQLLRAKEP